MDAPFPLTIILCVLGGFSSAGAQIAGGGTTGAADSTSPPANPGIAVGAATVNAQGSAQIDVTFTSAGRAVTGIQFDIQYQNQASGLSVSLGTAASNAGKNIWTSNPQPTQVRVLIAGLNQNPIADGVIASLLVPLPAGAYPGLYPLAISNAVITTSNGMAIYVSTSDGGAIVPGPTVLAVKNGASWLPGAVAPGEVVVIGGNSLGSATTTTLQITSTGLVATSLAGTRVLFDGIAAPLLYTTQNLVSAVVPYEVAGNTQTSLQVEYQAIQSAPFILGVTGTSPGIFTLDGAGAGQGAIVNQDGTLNGPANPAATGTVVSIYGTGEGQTDPLGVDGSIVSSLNLRHPLAPVAVSIGGQNADVIYAGSAGNQVSGMFQVNVRVPSSITPGGSVPVTITIGGSTQSGVTMAVQ
jgi:uncharacterized protein (TIGR03437 family)